MMKILHADSPEFEEELQRLLRRGGVTEETVLASVREIIDDVARRGDDALFDYALRFDESSLDAGNVRVADEEIDRALDGLDPADRDVLVLAAERIERFHRRQVQQSWFTIDEDGTELGQLVRPLRRVGVYAPGGLAPYPSTVLMAAIPARVAGVQEVLLVTPAKKGYVSPLILAAARIAGVDHIYRVGGPQAVAALACGTESIPAVDKIVGPGNRYVAAAKRLVFGSVGIDMIAGPTEILIIADETASPVFIAADLLAQAEHDELASSILITPSGKLAERVAEEVDRQLQELPRESIAASSINRYGRAVVTGNLEEAIALANRFAPEHLELMVAAPRELLGMIENASAVFLGSHTPEAVGDYVAGPNHILPTAGTARFSSPLGVYDFVKRTGLVSFTGRSLDRIGDAAARFAMLEGLDAHAISVKRRRTP